MSRPPLREKDELFLPDLCAMRMVFVVIIIAQLAAFVLALAPLDQTMTQRWNNLGMISLYVQWCALGSCTLLCLLRPWLRRFSDIQAGFISYMVILLVVIGITELAYWMVYRPGYESSMAWHWQFLGRNVAIAALIAGPILRYFYVQNQWRKNIRAENEARLQALQSRIRPHFLFNSMNTIASLVHAEPERAEQTVENLSDMFRACLTDARERIPLKEELALCKQYLDIEALRLGERLQQEWHIDAIPGDALVPPLLIQPLLENAVYHGIEPLTHGGCIRIGGDCQNKQVRICISNPVDQNAPRRASRGNHLAQDNVQQRLTALYGSHGQLDIEHSENTYQVTVTLPYQNEYEDPDRR